MKYDAATKILMTSCRDEIIRSFLGIDVRESHLITELHQETVSLKRSDYPIMITDEADHRQIVIIELQTRWNRHVPLHLLDYRTRHLIKHDVPVISCILLLRPSTSAANSYADSEVHFQYRLVDLSKMDAGTIINEGSACLMPFVPLMRNGRDLAEQADNLIYGSSHSREQKADLLTSMAILSGLIDADLPARLIARRRDIMIESAAYDIIIQEGLKAGKEQGLKEGRQEGIQQGIQQGVQLGLQGMRHSIKALLEVKFGVVEGVLLYRSIRHIDEMETLEMLVDVISKADKQEDVKKFLEQLKA